MGIIIALFLGLICGALARVFLPGKHEMGLIATLFLGITGCFAARIVGVMLGVYAPGETAGLIGGVIGSIGVLWGYEQFATQNPSYSREVAGKFNQVVGQFKSAAKSAAAGVQDVAFREKPQGQQATAAEQQPPSQPEQADAQVTADGEQAKA